MGEYLIQIFLPYLLGHLVIIEVLTGPSLVFDLSLKIPRKAEVNRRIQVT